jgi:hypothetical protein
MIELPQYEYETKLYAMTPIEYRWVYNKLMVAERLGIECGPCGVVPPHDGPWCYRPITNLHGCGKGGWLQGVGHWYRAGWFWMPWYEGRQVWTEYIDDEPVRQAGGFLDGVDLKWERSYDFVPLPEQLRGISKYSVQESIGGNLIEWAPKHLADNKDCIMDMRMTADANGDPLWEELWETARPW